VSGPVVVLAGGTGGAKLARGMLDVVGPDSLVVIANTGDDIEIYGGYVSPDPDLNTFWLADRINARGWGIEGDTFSVMEGLRAIGVDTWFNLGDQDLAICLERARLLQAGERLTTAQAAIVDALNVGATVLPMCDEPVRTRVMAGGRWWPLQEYMIKAGGARAEADPVQDIDYRGAKAATPTAEVRQAIETAQAIIIGPSNPAISIGPILAVNGMRDALTEADAPVVAVSPLVGGEVIKGPTKAFMEFANLPVTSDGIAAYYDRLIAGLVADQRTQSVPVLNTDVLMDSPDARRRVADQTLNFAHALR
jgi:LPPG:FO 2-phospho-L-lactate transferase